MLSHATQTDAAHLFPEAGVKPRETVFKPPRVDAFDCDPLLQHTALTPIIGKTVNIAGVRTPSWVAAFLDPPGRTWVDRLLGRAPDYFVASESVPTSILDDAMFTAAPAIRSAQLSMEQAAPSTLFMAHFAASIAAACRHCDGPAAQGGRMEATKSFVGVQLDEPLRKSIGYSVALYLRTDEDGIEPVGVETDARIYTAKSGKIRALLATPEQYQLTYPVLENAFAKLAATVPGYVFKPFGWTSTDDTSHAIANTLSAVTGSCVLKQRVGDLSAEAFRATLNDSKRATLLVFPPLNPDSDVAPSLTTPAKRMSLKVEIKVEGPSVVEGPPFIFYFLRNVPYAVSRLRGADGVELVNVLESSGDASWYTDDAPGIDALLTQQGRPRFVVPLDFLLRLGDVQLFSSQLRFTQTDQDQISATLSANIVRSYHTMSNGTSFSCSVENGVVGLSSAAKKIYLKRESASGGGFVRVQADGAPLPGQKTLPLFAFLHHFEAEDTEDLQGLLPQFLAPLE